MKRILALDVGDRRIGVAVSDPLGLTAQPVGTIACVGWGPDAKKVAELAQRYDAAEILCGLPLNMDGTEGGQAAKVRGFAARLTALGLSVRFSDERLTTVAAEEILIESGVSRKNRRGIIDTAAAMQILQADLDEKRE